MTCMLLFVHVLSFLLRSMEENFWRDCKARGSGRSFIIPNIPSSSTPSIAPVKCKFWTACCTLMANSCIWAKVRRRFWLGCELELNEWLTFLGCGACCCEFPGIPFIEKSACCCGKGWWYGAPTICCCCCIMSCCGSSVPWTGGCIECGVPWTGGCIECGDGCCVWDARWPMAAAKACAALSAIPRISGGADDCCGADDCQLCCMLAGLLLMGCGCCCWFIMMCGDWFIIICGNTCCVPMVGCVM